MELAILIGLQASGKSTFWRQRLAGSHVVVSKDLMRNNPDKNRRQLQLLREALSAGRSAVVDNTNVRRQDRAPLIALGRELGARVVGYFFLTEARGCLARNARREGRARVPDVAIHAAAARLERPERSEGFDQLFLVSLSAEGFEVRSSPET